MDGLKLGPKVHQDAGNYSSIFIDSGIVRSHFN